MNIFDDYLSTIQAAMSADTKASKRINESLDGLDTDHFEKAFSYADFQNRIPEKKLLPSLETFATELGLSPDFEQKLGSHPDFLYLKGSGKTEQHYIVSMFVDVKGSTNLFKRYNPETVLIITNTIQRAAIHTCLIFGGYVHRLHGDGLFIYLLRG